MHAFTAAYLLRDIDRTSGQMEVLAPTSFDAIAIVEDRFGLDLAAVQITPHAAQAPAPRPPVATR